MNQDTPPLERLQDLLRELLQLDLADLDFGIYRLLRIKHDEVTAFLEEQLPSAVDEAFASATDAERAAVLDEVETLADQIRDDIAEDALNADGSVAEEYRDVKAKAIRELVDEYEAARARLDSIRTTDAQKTEVFNHLYDFFRRYYEDGDFIPKRRYGAREHYAIPYNGEETLLHWANRGQHYVKNAEVFKDYAFTVEGDLLAEPARVRFVLTKASTPPEDTKGDTRYFFGLPESIEWDEDSRTLVVPFEYRLPSETEAKRFGRTQVQETILDQSLDELREGIPDGALTAALMPDTSEDDDNTEAPPLVRHLRRFVRRNTADYFIHRDLRSFLERELEFYTKDRLFYVTDPEEVATRRFRMLRVFRHLAGQVIDFVAQLEEVQRTLYEKRKFVLQREYLVLAAAVPRALWSEVLNNERQVEEWRQLFGTGPNNGALIDSQIDESFLEAHPTLVVNTGLFAARFRDQLLASFEDIDEATALVLVKSDNYQALRLLEPRFRGEVKCVYIDPPYNTGSDDFLYKDRYRHSSWLAMMEGRLASSANLLSTDASVFISVDANERDRLRMMADRVFGERNFLNTFVWINNLKGRQISSKGAAGTHEYVLAYGRDHTREFTIPVTRAKNLMPSSYKGFNYDVKEDEFGQYVTKNQLYNTNSKFNEETRPNLVFNIHWNPETSEVKFSDVDEDVSFEGFVLIPPKQNNDGTHKYHAWRWSKAKIRDEKRDLEFVQEGETVRIFTKVRGFEETALKDTITNISTNQGSNDLEAIVGDVFPHYPKPVSLIKIFLGLTSGSDIVMDFFAGSGTTGQALLDLNREDGGSRKGILIEMGPHFSSVLVPRVARAMFTTNWDSQVPSGIPTEDEARGRRPITQILHLESYEDSLHNLAASATRNETWAREDPLRKAQGANTYRLHYLASLPLTKSESMLAVDALENPFRYELEVLTDTGPAKQTVDLVETFNLIYGIRVRRIQIWTNEADDRFYKAVIGEDPDGQRTLVLWRDMEDLDPAVERTFLEQRISEADPPYDVVLINGDSTVPGVRSLDPIFKARMMEGESS